MLIVLQVLLRSLTIDFYKKYKSASKIMMIVVKPQNRKIYPVIETSLVFLKISASLILLASQTI